MSKVTITKERLKKLEDIEYKMQCLEQGGVDNWEFYGDSLEEYFKEKEQEEKVDSLLIDIQETLSCGAYEPSERGAGFAFDEGCIEDTKEILVKFIREIKADK